MANTAEETLQRFVDALEKLHSSGDVDAIADLFADDATLNKVPTPHEEHGKDGARTFWQQYRDGFDTVEATFRHRMESDGVAFLEWTSRGSLKGGNDFEYDGVSVLEIDGDDVTAFRTYYDTSAFLGN